MRPWKLVGNRLHCFSSLFFVLVTLWIMTHHQRRKYLIGWEKLKMWLADFTSFYSEKLQEAASIKDRLVCLFIYESGLILYSVILVCRDLTDCVERDTDTSQYSFDRVRPDLLKYDLMFKPAERLCFILQNIFTWITQAANMQTVKVTDLLKEYLVKCCEHLF